MRQACILAGGKGTRLQGLAGDRPKPFIDINGRPFIDRLIRKLESYGIDEILILAGHAANWIISNYRNEQTRAKVHIIREEHAMGTGGALWFARDYLDDQFLLLNGDSIIDGNYARLWPLMAGDTSVAMALRNVEDTSRYGSVVIENGLVTSFVEKVVSGHGLINTGVYAVKRNDILPLIAGTCSLENDILPQLVTKKSVCAAVLDGYFLDIGLPDTLGQARRSLDKNLKRPALIFDRDNTLIKDKGYTHKVSDLIWMPGALESIAAANDQGFGVFVATNQSGIARGYYKTDDMNAFHDEMRHQLLAYGATIDAFYHCPHHTDGAIKELARHCNCRKPGTKMLEDLFADHNLDAARSVMIGDQKSDVECGRMFGLDSFLYTGGSLMEFLCSKKILRN